MPRTKKYVKRKRAYRKKRVLRKQNNSRLIVAHLKNKNVMPPRYVTKMCYSDIATFTGLVSVDKVYRLNSLFDPDLTGTGHQPRYYDEMSNLYSAYRVLSCKVRVRPLSNSQTNTSANQFTSVIARLAAGTLNGASYFDIGELPNSTTILNGLYGGLSKGITKRFDIAYIAGVPKQVVKYDNNFKALISANPSHQLYVHVVNGTLNGTTATDCTMLIDLEYTVSWEDPIFPALS